MGLRIEGDLNVSLGLRCGRIEDDDMHFLKMFQKRMEIVELKTTAGVILTLKHHESEAE